MCNEMLDIRRTPGIDIVTGPQMISVLLSIDRLGTHTQFGNVAIMKACHSSEGSTGNWCDLNSGTPTVALLAKSYSTA